MHWSWRPSRDAAARLGGAHADPVTYPAMHQDHGSIWFWTDGQWTSLDLIAHTAAVEAAYAIIVAFDWAQYVVDLKSSDRRARDEAVQLATSLLHAPPADGDAVRSMNTQSYVRYVVSESDENPLAAANLIGATTHAQRVFDHGLPRLSVDRVAMAPGQHCFSRAGRPGPPISLSLPTRGRAHA